MNHYKVLTTKQADFINKELNVGKGIMLIKKIVRQHKSVNTESDNAYQKALLTETENDKKKSPAQMKEWSILSDHVKYVTSDGSEIFHNLYQMNYRQERDLYKELQEKELVSAGVNFGRSPEKLKAKYLDVYEGVYAKVISTDDLMKTWT